MTAKPPAAALAMLTLAVPLAAAQLPAPVELRPDDLAGSAAFGRAVDIAGGVIAVGRLDVNDTGPGSVYVYDAASLALLRVLRPDEPIQSERFGSAIAIDGDLILIGADGQGRNPALTGSAYLFDLTTGSQLARLTSPVLEAADAFGAAVALDGPLALVAAPRDDENGTNAGRVYVFDVSDPAAPAEVARLQHPSADPHDGFGTDLAISGPVAAIAAPLALDTGAVYLYSLVNPAAPAPLTQPIQAPDAGVGTSVERFGVSIDLDAARLLVGTHNNGAGLGAAYLFDIAFPASPQFRSRFQPSTGGDIADFGYAVALSGDTAVIGAAEDSNAYYRSGAAFAFDLSDPADPVEVARLERTLPDDFDRIGYAVAIDGDTVVAGGYDTRTQGQNTGLAIVFSLAGPCSPADVAEPFAVLDLADIAAFVSAYASGDPSADLEPDGVFDLADITAFIGVFVAGCP